MLLLNTTEKILLLKELATGDQSVSAGLNGRPLKNLSNSQLLNTIAECITKAEREVREMSPVRFNHFTRYALSLIISELKYHPDIVKKYSLEYLLN